jgi:hypothetical protein
LLLVLLLLLVVVVVAIPGVQSQWNWCDDDSGWCLVVHDHHSYLPL